MRRRSPPATAATSSTCSATSSERRSAPAKPNSSRARSRLPRALASQVATSWRNMARVSAAAFCGGRPWVRSSPCSGPWMSRWAGFQPRSLKGCIFPVAGVAGTDTKFLWRRTSRQNAASRPCRRAASPRPRHCAPAPGPPQGRRQPCPKSGAAGTTSPCITGWGSGADLPIMAARLAPPPGLASQRIPARDNAPIARRSV